MDKIKDKEKFKEKTRTSDNKVKTKKTVKKKKTLEKIKEERKQVKEKLLKEAEAEERRKFPTRSKVQLSVPVIKSYNRKDAFKNEFCEQLINHMSQGYTFDQFCVDLRVTPCTLYIWKKKYPEFENAYHIGKQSQRKFYLSLLIKSATTKEMNSAVTIFLAKNRLNMTDKSETISSINQNSEGLVVTTQIGNDGQIVKRQLTMEEEKELVKKVLNTNIVIDAYKKEEN
jgi:hypothetical protein